MNERQPAEKGLTRWERLVEWFRWNWSCCGWRSSRHDWRDWRDGGCDCNCHEEIGYV